MYYRTIFKLSTESSRLDRRTCVKGTEWICHWQVKQGGTAKLKPRPFLGRGYFIVITVHEAGLKGAAEEKQQTTILFLH